MLQLRKVAKCVQIEIKLTLTRSVWGSYSKTRMPGLFAPSMTPGSVVFHGVTPGVRNIALIGEPKKQGNPH